MLVYRKSLNHAYELLVLQEGDFDERVFLNCTNDIECSSIERRDSDHDFERSELLAVRGHTTCSYTLEKVNSTCITSG